MMSARQKMNAVFKGSAVLVVFGSMMNLSAMVPNPIISRGKPVFSSSGSMPGLVDNKFKNPFFTVTNNSWVAINVGTGPSKVFFSWRDPDSAWANAVGPCHFSYNLIADYDVLTSSNSSNGSDGTWIKVDSVRGNFVTTRGHILNFTGLSWIKMAIIKGGSKLDEIEVFDISKGAEDQWCFVGTSITQMAFKDNPPAKNFADLVNAAHPKFNPAMIMAGINCIASGDMVNNLYSTYLPSACNTRFWAIEMGANDAFRGVSPATFSKNMSIIIDSCLAKGIRPVISRTPFLTSKAGAPVPVGYLTAIDSLTKAYKLIAGPDFYSYFQTNPGELKSDGTHPNSTGVASIQRLWAEKMSALYADTTTGILAPRLTIRSLSHLQVLAHNGTVVLRSPYAGTAFLFGVDGKLLGKVAVCAAATESIAKGRVLLVKFVSSKGMEVMRMVEF